MQAEIEREIPEKLKLLVVEDDKISLKQYEKRTSDRIFQKEYAEDGEIAIQRYREWGPDIILLDLMLPNRSGYSLLKEIRANDPLTTIIIISSLNSKEDILDCVKMGIQGYMVKPVNFSALNMKILEYYERTNPEKAKIAATFKQHLLELDADS